MQPFARRRDTLSRCLEHEGIDALLVGSAVNVTYLTGFSGDSSYLLLAKNRSLLVSDARFPEQIVEECPGLETFIRPPTLRPLNAVAQTLDRLGYRNVGFESGAMTVAELEGLKKLAPTLNWKGEDGRVETLRMVKDDTELKQIREAIAIAERAFAAFCGLLARDDSEEALCHAMDGYLRKAGAKCSSFPPIIAAGPRSALAHAPPTTRKASDGAVLLIDWGAAGRFYKSDLTRVLDPRTNGDSPHDGPKLEEIHAIVDRARQAAIARVRPGIKAMDVDAAARQLIADAGHGERFGHGLGHGIGLQVHEGPAIRPGSETTLMPGMVFTIEPGIYVPGWGGVRIEDDVLVTPDGCEVLSHLSRDPLPAFGG